MSTKEIFEKFTQTTPFGGFPTSFENSNYVIFGVPFDGTTSYYPGSRFGPDSIRQASLNIETFNMVTKKDLEDELIFDMGNLILSPSDSNLMLNDVSDAVSFLISHKKIPILLGGEHLVTLGSLKGAYKTLSDTQKTNFGIIHFDAHFDLRDELYGDKISHGTFMRRFVESTKASVLSVGIRAPSKEEFYYANNNTKISFITCEDIYTNFRNSLQIIKEFLSSKEIVYITFDMDVFSPSEVPGVGNPEPGGLNYFHVREIIKTILNTHKKIIGFDVTELNPLVEGKISPTYAAKVVFDMLTFHQA